MHVGFVRMALLIVILSGAADLGPALWANLSGRGAAPGGF